MSDRAISPAVPVEQKPLPLGLTVNGMRRTIAVEPRTTLFEALRETLALTETKKGCDRGECGAEANGPKAIVSFAAVFGEVCVDPDLGQMKLSRFVCAYDAGRIINPKTARSQAIGGIIWGVGQALLEQSETDPVLGRFLHRYYSGHLVPTNADIPELETLFVGAFDGEASPLGAKGLGELTAVSVAPAIANAVYHATGKWIRELPITIEKLL
jgi:xanthine dehydrogenase YagR molybdenum-binding subunit